MIERFPHEEGEGPPSAVVESHEGRSGGFPMVWLVPLIVATLVSSCFASSEIVTFSLVAECSARYVATFFSDFCSESKFFSMRLINEPPVMILS